jgi:ABC-type multidrug transport system fused ATPase/permease subunit
MGFYCKRWLGVRLGWINTVLIIVAYSVPNIVLFVLNEYRQLSILEMALAISWSLKLVGYFNTFINSIVRIHSAIVSFGRIEYYLTKVKTEATDKRPLAVSYEGKAPALKLIQVSKKFGNRQVVKNVNFSVEKYSKVAIFGDSGCGKHILSKLIMKVYSSEDLRVINE